MPKPVYEESLTIMEQALARDTLLNDSRKQNIRDACELSEKTGTHILASLCPMGDMLDHMEDYITFIAGLGVRRMVIQKLYPQTQRYRELDPFIGREEEEVQSIWQKVQKHAQALGVHIESNFIEFFNEENTCALKTRFDILQENAYVCELFQPGFCFSTATNLVVEYDGSVLPCVNDRIVLGNLHESAIEEIWNGEPMQALRRTHFEEQLSPRCRTCSAFYNLD